MTVAVLNGTSTTNLAHDISQKLSSAGYKAGNIATATDQTRDRHRSSGICPDTKPDALAVAKSLKLSPSAVQAVDASNRTLACNGSSTSLYGPGRGHRRRRPGLQRLTVPTGTRH